MNFLKLLKQFNSLYDFRYVFIFSVYVFSNNIINGIKFKISY